MCFAFRWAVSTVMTRQNQIPALVGEVADTALIPLWDMCNHISGQVGFASTPVVTHGPHRFNSIFS